MFYKISDRDLLKIRKEIFLNYGIPILFFNGFEKSPFLGACYGKNNLGGLTYDLIRISVTGYLEKITVHISKGDRYIKIFLNIFEIKPKAVETKELESVDGIKFDLPPNSLTQMRLRSDDYKIIPLFYWLFCPAHKIGCYLSRSGFERQVKKLERLISRDMGNIDSFVKRWHELHTPAVTDREGNRKQ